MYATLSYDIATGASPVEDVRKAIVEAFTGCDTCDLLADTFIVRVASTKDFLDRTQLLKQIADDFAAFQLEIAELARLDRARFNLRECR